MRMTHENFNVQILNPEEVKNVFTSWGNSACICYDTPQKFAERVGKSCLQTGHFSGSRGDYIKFKITGVPRALIDQLVRHEVGVYKNVKSQRYTDSSNLGIYYPSHIIADENLSTLWDNTIEIIQTTYAITVNSLKEKGFSNEQAREVARGLTPMNVESGVVIGFTIEALINFMHKRLCSCSQDHIRWLASKMKREVITLLPELKEYLVPICMHLMYCPEKPDRSCGIRPQRSEIEQLIKNSK